MTRDADVQVLEDYREAIRHVRRVLDDLARSDAKNTAEINGLRRDLDALERRWDTHRQDMTQWVRNVEKKADSGQRARWKSAGGWAAIVGLATVLAGLGGLIIEAIRSVRGL